MQTQSIVILQISQQLINHHKRVETFNNKTTQSNQLKVQIETYLQTGHKDLTIGTNPTMIIILAILNI